MITDETSVTLSNGQTVKLTYVHPEVTSDMTPEEYHKRLQVLANNAYDTYLAQSVRMKEVGLETDAKNLIKNIIL